MLSKTTLSTMLVGVITLGCLVNAQAQDPKALIQKMAAAYKNVKSYSGVLEIEQIAAGKKQTATITIMYSGQKAYQHSIATGGKTPEDVLTVDDGKFAYFQKNTKEYMKGPHQNVPKFTMGESIAKGLSVPQVQLKLMPSTVVAGKPVFSIEVSSPGGKAMLYISKANNRFVQLKMIAPQGSFSRTIKKEQLNPSVPASYFVYHIPKGAVEKKAPTNPGMPGGGMPKKP